VTHRSPRRHRFGRRPAGVLPLLPRRIGFRGSILVLFGLTWLIVGFGTYTAPKVPGLLISEIPSALKGLGWFVTGLYAVATGLLSRWRDDSHAFVGLYVMPAVWTLLYLWSWFIFLVHHWDWHLWGLFDNLGPGYERGWVQVPIFFLITGIVMICAGWPEPIEEGDPR